MKIYQFVLLRPFRGYILQRHRRRPDVRRTDSIVLCSVRRRSPSGGLWKTPSATGSHLSVVIYSGLYLLPPPTVMPAASFRAPLPSVGSTTMYANIIIIIPILYIIILYSIPLQSRRNPWYNVRYTRVAKCD